MNKPGAPTKPPEQKRRVLRTTIAVETDRVLREQDESQGRIIDAAIKLYFDPRVQRYIDELLKEEK